MPALVNQMCNKLWQIIIFTALNTPFVRLPIFISVLILTVCACQDNYEYTPVVVATHPAGEGFVASESCMECHSDIYKQHLETAHYQTSSEATSDAIGAFDLAESKLPINDSLIIQFERLDDLYVQKTYHRDTGKLVDSTTIDLVFGSGTKGKSYAHWQNDSLYQLHASYLKAANSLIKSPGLVPRLGLQNNRVITERCLECHSTYAQTQSVENTFDRSQLLLGIDCQRCHGPLEKHVSFHKNNPTSLEPKFVDQISGMSRQQQLDMCALCHSGPRKRALKDRFSYKIGDALRESSTEDFFSTAAHLDVHGNQVGLLMASKCFQNSENMTCTTCHDPHKNQRNQTAYFDSKCLSCHDSMTAVMCAIPSEERDQESCVSCHMPKTVSKTMFAKNGINEDTVNVEVVSHYIKVYLK